MPNGIPNRYINQPELVAAVIEARTLQMRNSGDTKQALQKLTDTGMSLASAEKVLNNETFVFTGLYPKRHPGLQALLAEQRIKHKRQYNLSKLRPQIIERDDGRCQNCEKRVKGKDAQLDHKDPEGPETLENIHLLCQTCNLIKGSKTWEQFKEDQEKLRQIQNNRPDIVCTNSNLSIKGRSWNKSGCTGRGACIQLNECLIKFNECLCTIHGCPPNCTGCNMCDHENESPHDIVCPADDTTPFGTCPTEAFCKTLKTCQLIVEESVPADNTVLA